jgi:hypothetical protein
MGASPNRCHPTPSPPSNCCILAAVVTGRGGGWETRAEGRERRGGGRAWVGAGDEGERREKVEDQRQVDEKRDEEKKRVWARSQVETRERDGREREGPSKDTIGFGLGFSSGRQRGGK